MARVHRLPQLHSRTVLIVFIALSAITSFSGCKKEDSTANIDHHIYLAENYVEQGQLKAALLEAKTVLQAEPKNTRAAYVIANVMLTSGDLKSAEKKLSELVKLEPTNERYVFSLVEALIQSKKQHSAAFELAEYEATAPNNLTAEFYTLQGETHLLRPELAKGEQSFQQALKADPGYPEAYLGLAKIAHVQKKPEKRDQLTQQALDNSPYHLKTWLWIANVAMEVEEYPRAEEAYSNALLEMKRFDTMTATKYLTLNGLVRALIAQGKTDDALRYSETLAQSPQGKLQSSLKDAIGAFRTGDFSIAEQTFQEILERAPGHGLSGTALGIIKYTQGDLAEAENFLTQALEGGGIVPLQAYKLLAITRIQLDRPKESLEIIENGLKEAKNDSELYAIQGLAYLKLEKLDQARRSLNKALKIAPDSNPVLLTLADVDVKEKKYDDAWRVYSKVLKTDSNNMVGLKGLVDVSIAQDKADKGVEVLQKIIKDNPKSINPILILSASSLKSNNYDKAIDYAQQAFAIEPENKKVVRLLATTYYAKSRSLMNANNTAGALQYIRKAYEKSPNAMPIVLTNINLEMRSNNVKAGEDIAKEFIKNNPKKHQGYEILGDIFIKQSRFNEAVTSLESAWEITQNHLLGIKLFRAQNALRQDDDAIKHLTQWITTSNNTPASLFTLAMAYQEMQQPTKAIPQYEAVLQQKPDHIVSLNNLAWLYQEAGHEDAERLAKKAHELAPNSAPVADTYGWILVLNGQKEAGINILQTAAKLAPGNKDIEQHLKEAEKK